MTASVSLILMAAVLSLNLGGSNFSASFAAAHGGGTISKKKAQMLFCLFVFLGAAVMGKPVAETLGHKIIPGQFLNTNTALLILFSETVSIWLANVLHVPQSTSLVTVASIAGVGLCLGWLNGNTIFRMLLFWITLPAAGYFLTYVIGKTIYPPRKGNFWIYEKLANHNDRLKAFIIFASCFNAFSIGTNNVANVAGPVSGTGLLSITTGLLMFAPMFGLGGLVYHHSLHTAGEKIVPLGLLTATVICLVTGTLMITASLFGIPQSFVMIKVACIVAVGGLKNGHSVTFANPSTRKTCIIWGVTPLLALGLSFLLTKLTCV